MFHVFFHLSPFTPTTKFISILIYAQPTIFRHSPCFRSRGNLKKYTPGVFFMAKKLDLIALLKD